MKISQTTRAIVWFNNKGLCGMCGEPVDPCEMHVDHITPRSLSGPDTADNLRPTHPACNLGRPRERLGWAEHRDPIVQFVVRVPNSIRREALLFADEHVDGLVGLMEEALAWYIDALVDRKVRLQDWSEEVTARV